jgi:hypothetical protein
MEDYRWVSCSKDLSWSASERRHLINRGGLTTVCGNTASHPEVWRTNSTKLNCERCMELGKDIVKYQTDRLLDLLGPR